MVYSLLIIFTSHQREEDYNTGFSDLDSGVCDALIVDIGSAKYQITHKNNGEKYKILDEPLAYEVYGIGFKKGNEELRNQVQDTLDEMYADGTVDKIAQKYSDYGTFATKTKSYVSSETAKKCKKAHCGDLVFATVSENIDDVCKCF